MVCTNERIENGILVGSGVYKGYKYEYEEIGKDADGNPRYAIYAGKVGGDFNYSWGTKTHDLEAYASNFIDKIIRSEELEIKLKNLNQEFDELMDMDKKNLTNSQYNVLDIKIHKIIDEIAKTSNELNNLFISSK